ncbi:MAG: hypothetical protein QOF78_1279 [Phycisphaerales bacterium]|nr:hypothetical protein [Phycisphaerales bacterium]
MCHLRVWASFIVLVIASAALAETPETTTYTNPLPTPEHVADPFVYREGDTYYLYRRGMGCWSGRRVIS